MRQERTCAGNEARTDRSDRSKTKVTEVSLDNNSGQPIVRLRLNQRFTPSESDDVLLFSLCLYPRVHFSFPLVVNIIY